MERGAIKSIGKVCLETLVKGSSLAMRESSGNTSRRRFSLADDAKTLQWQKLTDDIASQGRYGMMIACGIVRPKQLKLKKVKEVILSETDKEMTPTRARTQNFIKLVYRSKDGQSDKSLMLIFDDVALYSVWTLSLSALVYIWKRLDNDAVDLSSSHVPSRDEGTESANTKALHELGSTGKHLVADILVNLVMKGKISKTHWLRVCNLLTELQWNFSSCKGAEAWLLQWARDYMLNQEDKTLSFSAILDRLHTFGADSKKIILFVITSCAALIKRSNQDCNKGLVLKSLLRFIAHRPTSFLLGVEAISKERQCIAFLDILLAIQYIYDLELEHIFVVQPPTCEKTTTEELLEMCARVGKELSSALKQHIEPGNLLQCLSRAFSNMEESNRPNASTGTTEGDEEKESLSSLCVINRVAAAAYAAITSCPPTENQSSFASVVPRRHSAPLVLSKLNKLYPIIEDSEQEKPRDCDEMANKIFKRVSIKMLENVDTSSDCDEQMVETSPSEGGGGEEADLKPKRTYSGPESCEAESTSGSSSESSLAVSSPSDEDAEPTESQAEAKVLTLTTNIVSPKNEMGNTDKGTNKNLHSGDYVKEFFATFRALERKSKCKRSLRRVRGMAVESLANLDISLRTLEDKLGVFVLSQSGDRPIGDGGIVAEKCHHKQLTARSIMQIRPKEMNQNVLKSALWNSVIRLSVALESEKSSHKQTKAELASCRKQLQSAVHSSTPSSVEAGIHHVS